MHFIFLKLFDDWGMTIWKSLFADCQSPDTSESQPLSSLASQQGIVCFDKASQHRWSRNLLNQRIGRLLLPWFLFGRNAFFLHMTQYMYKVRCAGVFKRIFESDVLFVFLQLVCWSWSFPVLFYLTRNIMPWFIHQGHPHGQNVPTAGHPIDDIQWPTGSSFRMDQKHLTSCNHSFMCILDIPLNSTLSSKY